MGVGRLGSGVRISASFQIFTLTAGGEMSRWGGKLNFLNSQINNQMTVYNPELQRDQITGSLCNVNNASADVRLYTTRT